MYMKRPLVLVAVLWSSIAHAGGAFIGQPGHFDYYVLTLSWEPSYCSQPNADPKECGGGDHGFVLHGLWPQMQAGGYPENCPSKFHLDPAALAYQQQNQVFPSEGLLQHEWTTHGVCDGRDATAYIHAAAQAHAAIHVPDVLQAGSHPTNITADGISQAFRQANPALTNRSVAVHCGGKALKEVQFCLGKDFQPVSCGNGVRTACPGGPLIVPSMH